MFRVLEVTAQTQLTPPAVTVGVRVTVAPSIVGEPPRVELYRILMVPSLPATVPTVTDVTALPEIAVAAGKPAKALVVGKEPTDALVSATAVFAEAARERPSVTLARMV